MITFKHWLTEGIAQLSYLIGDDGTHTAAVIDPRPDVGVYVEAARAMGLAITHIFETHIHADYMSGSRELAARLGSAEICASGEGDAGYGFEVRRLKDGETFRFGSAVLRARFTPGHTPEHMSYEICDASKDLGRPWGVLTGDSLFVDSAGRPDLLGDEQTEELVGQLFHTLRDYYLGLGDEVIIYPCHGKGSACGPDIGERLTSTIGYEREHNRYLKIEDLGEFKKAMLAAGPPAPPHYGRLKKVNGAGPPVLGAAGPTVPAMPPEAFQEEVERGVGQLVDARHMLAFGGGHIPGAVNLGANKAEMSVFAGWALDPERPTLLVLEEDAALERVVALLVRTGFTKFGGYLAGGMMAWNNAGLPLARVGQMHAREVAAADGRVQVLDVRQDDEWERGHVPGARHVFVGELRDRAPELAKDRPVVTYCATGYRASLAASLLKRAGIEDVRSMPGSWQAWKASGLPVEK